MTDRTIVTEFGSSKINIGLPGEGIPLKSWNCGFGEGDSSFLISRKNNNNNSSSSTTMLFSLRGGNNNNNNKSNNDIQLFDVESCGLWTSSATSNWIGDQTFYHLRHNVFGGGGGNNNQDSSSSSSSSSSSLFDVQIQDVEVASQVYSQLLSKTNFIGTSSSSSSSNNKNLLFVPSDQIFKNDETFQSWCEMILGTGVFSRLFSIRPAVAATIDAGRASAVVLDCGHGSAKINLVIDGVQRLLSPAFVARSVNCSGKNISKRLEHHILLKEENNNQTRNDDDDALLGTVHQDNPNKRNADFFNSYFPSSSSSTIDSPFQVVSRHKILQEIKHSCGYVYNQFDALFNNNNNNTNNDSQALHQYSHQQNKLDGQIKPAIFVAPDGEKVFLSGSTRSQCFEELFTYRGPQQNQQGRDPRNTSIIDLVVDLYTALPGEYKISLPLLCVGGTCRTEGFATRLSAELQKADSLFQRVNPAFPQDPFSQWRGASFLCAAPAFEEKGSWITQQKLDELGVNRIRKSIP